LQQHQSADLTAIGFTSAGDTADVAISWSATNGSITDTSTNHGQHRGRFRAGADTGRGKVVARGNPGGPSDTAIVIVTLAPVARLVMNPAAASVTVGQTVQLTATPQDSAGNPLSGRAVTWATTNPGVAAVNGSGVVSGVAAGAATVTAACEGQSGTVAITVTVVPVASVAVSPASATVTVGQTVQLAATPKDANGNPLTGRTVTWATSNAAVATVSGSGLVTGGAAGTATITASSEGRNGTAAISVTNVPVASVAVTPPTASVQVGQTVQLTAAPKDANGNPLTGRVVTWASSASAIATVSASGLVTGVAAGTATLTATSEGKSGTATVTVANLPVASVTVSPASASLFVGKTVQLAATTKDSAGNVLTGRTIGWASSNATVATVSATGLVTAKAPGSATITATSEGKSGTATVAVANVPVASVTVSPASASVVAGGTVQLTATTKDSAGNALTGRTISWASSNTTVAMVSATGLVTGVATGSATITATSEGKSGTAAVTVSLPAIRAGWYVAPTGLSSGDGSSGRPWNLQTALNGAGGRVHPGDTIWLRGGTYTGAINTTVTGTAAAPIIVRQYPGERAVLDANAGTSGSTRGDFFIVSGSYVTFWGFEVMNSDPNRTSDTRPNLVIANASHLKFVNLIVHDGGIGFYTYPEQSDIEIYGCLIYNNGWQQPDFGNGHGIYSKSSAGPVYLRDNIIFNQFGYGIHVYANAGSGGVNNIHVEGNVSFNNGAIDTDPVNSPNANILYGGGDPATGGSIVDNMTYFSPNVGTHNLMVGYSGTANIDLTVLNNYAAGGRTVFEVGSWRSLTMAGNSAFGAASNPVNLRSAATGGFQLSNNRYYRDPALRAWLYSGTSYTFSGWQQAAGVGATDQAQAATPTQPQVFVRPSRYEFGRGNVIIYNWGRQSSVPVDLSGVLQVGARYEIRNVQNFFATPVASGTYGGGTISIPMSGVTAVQPIGGSPTSPPRTGPDFDVFIVVTVSP
jgi:uncharacterized protein YjdB